MKALKYAYIGRKQKKRIFRKIWIKRINSSMHLRGTNYSKAINKLKKSKILLNRKMLAQLAVLDNLTLQKVLDITDQ